MLSTQTVDLFPAIPQETMPQIEKSQNFKQRYLSIALEQLATSNGYRTNAIVANYIAHSFVMGAWATAAFSNALGQYNTKYAVSLSLYLTSYIPGAFEKFFTEKAKEFRSLSKTNIDLADGREITHLTKFINPKT